jgi:four helix bundle protein
MVSLKELEVYKKCCELRRHISILTKNLPIEEKYELRSQIIRSSRSITANIAEGYGRYHYQENIQFLRIARGSLFETKDHISCGVEEKYWSKEDQNIFTQKFEESLRLINGYISYLKKQKDKT